ncbi:unnamed protein product [Prunus armeniaca]
MSPENEELTAFRTPKGIYCYKVMPFGLKNASATYQDAMQKIFGDILHKNVECYVGDLVIKSQRREDHLKDLRMVFNRLWKYQLKMNRLKCAFCVMSGKFLGFIVKHRGIEVDQSKIKGSFGSAFGAAKSTSKWVKALLSFKNGVWQKLQKRFG